MRKIENLPLYFLKTGNFQLQIFYFCKKIFGQEKFFLGGDRLKFRGEDTCPPLPSCLKATAHKVTVVAFSKPKRKILGKPY